jgi:hypothetical protein
MEKWMEIERQKILQKLIKSWISEQEARKMLWL